MKKLNHKWLGLFHIVKVISHAAIKLQLTSQERGIHPVISIMDIHKHTPDDIPECPLPTQPRPTIVEGQEEYKVEDILNSKYIRWQLHYYVKWKGYPISENCWVPSLDIEYLPLLVHHFHS